MPKSLRVVKREAFFSRRGLELSTRDDCIAAPRRLEVSDLATLVLRETPGGFVGGLAAVVKALPR